MDLTSWPQVVAINQKNYYTYVLANPGARNREIDTFSIMRLDI